MRTEYIFADQLSHVYAALMPQNRLICQLMEHTGLRVGDAVSLRTDSLRRRMTVREQKTGKGRRIYIPSALFAEIVAQAGPEWVFPGAKPGRHKTRQAVWKDLKRAAKAFRLPQNVAPHSLRKVYAVRLLAKYGDIAQVQRALMHDNVAVTLIYAMADKLTESGAKGARERRGVRRVA